MKTFKLKTETITKNKNKIWILCFAIIYNLHLETKRELSFCWCFAISCSKMRSLPNMTTDRNRIFGVQGTSIYKRETAAVFVCDHFAFFFLSLLFGIQAYFLWVLLLLLFFSVCFIQECVRLFENQPNGRECVSMLWARYKHRARCCARFTANFIYCCNKRTYEWSENEKQKLKENFQMKKTEKIIFVSVIIVIVVVNRVCLFFLNSVVLVICICKSPDHPFTESVARLLCLCKLLLRNDNDCVQFFSLTKSQVVAI